MILKTFASFPKIVQRFSLFHIKEARISKSKKTHKKKKVWENVYLYHDKIYKIHQK